MITVVYYSSSREPWSFESKVIEDLKAKAGGLPIVSVTQKPVDLGTNICVGEHVPCDAGVFRQFLIGVEAAKTDWILSAEADAFYPPDYFTFDFKHATKMIYRFNEVWIMRSWGGSFQKKEWSECAQLARRDWLIDTLQRNFEGWPEWMDSPLPKLPCPYKKRSWGHWGNGGCVINVKTGFGLRKVNRTLRDIPEWDSLPGWGTADSLRERWFNA